MSNLYDFILEAVKNNNSIFSDLFVAKNTIFWLKPSLCLTGNDTKYE